MHPAIFGETTRSDFSRERAEQSAPICFGSGKFGPTQRPLDPSARRAICALFGADAISVQDGTRASADGTALTMH